MADEGSEQGQVAFFVNIPRGDDLTQSEGDELAAQVADHFRSRVQSSPLSAFVTVGDYDWYRGCLITTITVTAVAAALYKGVKDYPDLRKGVLALARDLNGMRVALSRWAGRTTTVWFYYDQWTPDSDLKKAFRSKQK